MQNILKSQFSRYINKKDKEYKKMHGPLISKRKIKFLGLTFLKITNNGSKEKYYLFGFLRIFKKKIKHPEVSLGTNEIILVRSNKREEKIKSFPNLTFRFDGENNVIKLHEPLELNNTFIEITGNNNLVELDKTVVHYSLNIHLFDAENKFVKIGSSIIETLNMCGVNNSCEIGDDCAIAADNVIWFSDGHSVFDNETKEIINYTNTPPSIGNHVWLGKGVMLTKGAAVPSNSVVGMGSVVTKKFEEENICIAGNPAKIVKRNINWDTISPDKYKRKTERDLTNV